jgi:hypothetical protein
MALSDDEKKLLAELTEKSKEQDPDEAFEIEVYDTGNGRGARLPFSHGKKWLWENFGIGTDPNPEGGNDAGSGSDSEGKVKTGYFGRQQGKKTDTGTEGK